MIGQKPQSQVLKDQSYQQTKKMIANQNQLIKETRKPLKSHHTRMMNSKKLTF